MTKPLVYITRRLPQTVLDALAPGAELRMWDDDSPCPREVLLRECARADGVLTQATDAINAEFLNHAQQLRVIAHFGVGYNNIDVAACTARNIIVTNTPGVLTETTADMGFALLMAAARRIVEGQRCIEHDEWKYAAVPLHMAGQDIYRSTLGVIGAGRIGSGVLRRGRGFNMKLLYHNRNRSENLETETGASYRALDDLLAESNFVVLCAPLTPETRGLLGAREFALMRPGSVFVNISRGQTINEAALYDAILLGFSTIDPKVKEDLGDMSERVNYANRVLAWFAGEGEPDPSYIYLPLAMGGIVVNMLVASKDENPWLVVDQLTEANRGRARLASGEVATVFKVMDLLLNQAEDALRRARVTRP